MTDTAAHFPSLSAEATLADLQMRLTLAMGLIPLGIALLLMAAVAPDPPPPGLWGGAAAAAGGMGLIWGLWRRAGHRRLRGYSTVHFTVRYLFLILCPILLWTVFGGVILEMAGGIPPTLLALLFLLYPVGRILEEQIGADPSGARGLETARLVCRQFQFMMGVLAFTGILTGAIHDAQRDYPTDPTPLLLLIWLLTLLVLLGSGSLAAARWKRLFGRPVLPQPLDDPPSRPPPEHALRFGSERF